MSDILSVRSLTVRAGEKTLVSNLSFSIEQGARVGLIGESGSGKTLTALAVLGLLPAPLSASGSIRLERAEIVGASERVLVRLRGSVATMVFQEPLTALDPLMPVGNQIAEPLRRRSVLEGEKPSGREVRAAVIRALDEVALPDPARVRRAFPHELSGGQRQRVALAMALACRPKLLIADEPTTALDVTIQAEILALLNRLIRERGMSLLFIGHDLPVVAQVADALIVMKEGVSVEQGATRTVLSQPGHAYTRSLVEAARELGAGLQNDRSTENHL